MNITRRKIREGNSNEYKLEVRTCRCLIREAKGISEIVMSRRAKDEEKASSKNIRSQQNATSSVTALLGSEGRVVAGKESVRLNSSVGAVPQIALLPGEKSRLPSLPPGFQVRKSAGQVGKEQK